MWGKDVFGYVPPFLENTERYVALRKIQSWLDQGLTEQQIFLTWNQGHPGKCVQGTNKHGVKYNSCAYAESGLALLR